MYMSCDKKKKKEKKGKESTNGFRLTDVSNAISLRALVSEKYAMSKINVGSL